MASRDEVDSDASSVTYGFQQQEAPPMQQTDNKPIIARKDSAKSVRSITSSKSGTTSTYYSEEDIKELGYRPFEYYKAPKTTAKKIKPPPPPITAVSRAHSRRTETSRSPPRVLAGHRNPSMNALQEFKPLPRAKVFEVRKYMDDIAIPTAPVEAAVPPSPRVKDRYAARLAAKRNARAARRRALEGHQGGESWPGWAPNEKAMHGGGGKKLPMAAGMVKRPASAASTLLSRGSERWSSPSTWRRRVWGIVACAVMLLLFVVVIVLVTVGTADNVPSISLHLRPVEDWAAAQVSAPALSVLVAAEGEPRRLVARRFEG